MPQLHPVGTTVDRFAWSAGKWERSDHSMRFLADTSVRRSSADVLRHAIHDKELDRA